MAMTASSPAPAGASHSESERSPFARLNELLGPDGRETLLAMLTKIAEDF